MSATPNYNYNRGRYHEYRVRDYFEKMGFVVYRSAGSHKPADLICFPTLKPDGKTLLVQCKVDAKLMSQKERQEFKSYCDNLRVLGVLVSREKRKVTPIYLI